MKAKIAGLFAVALIGCMEETPINRKMQPLPQSTLQFQSTTLTVIEGQKAGDIGSPVSVVISTNDTPKEPTRYYVIMKYKATDLGNGTYSSRFTFDGSHTKFDGTKSIPIVLKSSLDDFGTLTTVIQMEFEKHNLASAFKVLAVNDGQAEADETASLEITTTNPISGTCQSHLETGDRKSASVTIQDFH